MLIISLIHIISLLFLFTYSSLLIVYILFYNINININILKHIINKYLFRNLTIII